MAFRPTALLQPARSHPEVIIQAVTARNREKAENYAKKHNVPQVIESYEGKSHLISVHLR